MPGFAPSTPARHVPSVLVTRLAGVPLPEEDVELLTTALGSQLAAVSVLDELDLTDVNPAVEFDASWT